MALQAPIRLQRQPACSTYRWAGNHEDRTCCRECFLREEELEGALEAFEAAKPFAQTADATAHIDAFIAATEKALKGARALHDSNASMSTQNIAAELPAMPAWHEPCKLVA